MNEKFNYEKHSYCYEECNKNDLTHGAYIHLNRILEFLKNVPANKKILDYGCGAGALLRSLQKESPDLEYYGVDISTIAINEAKSLSTNITYTTITDKTNFEDRFFDVILMCEVLEHVPNPDTTLNEITRILTSQGTFFLAVPQEKSLLTLQGMMIKIANFKPSTPTAGHLWFWTYKELEEKLTTHHLKIIAHTYSQHTLWQIIGITYMLLLIATKNQTQELSKRLNASPSIFSKLAHHAMLFLVLITNIESLMLPHAPHGLDIQFYCTKGA
jgi:2-polyprenyl-3-methyl-5-hydroxy-6-metoxy-1,4-benzoquinol methylase